MAPRGVPACYLYLESGSSDGVDPLEASRDQFSLAHVEQPVELAARVLRTVEGCKPTKYSHKNNLMDIRIIERKRSSGFRRIFTIVFLLFLASAGQIS